jgi:aspartate 1-decarboxylase
MRRTVFKSKIHRATVTDGNLDYEGSLSIDQDLLDAADILPNEQIHVWDVTNGVRLITYALSAKRGSGEVCVNGAGAHLIKKGDVVIVATFTQLRTKEAKKYKPTVVLVDGKNGLITNADTEPTQPETPVDAESTPAIVAPEAEAVVSVPAKRVRRK